MAAKWSRCFRSTDRVARQSVSVARARAPEERKGPSKSDESHENPNTKRARAGCFRGKARVAVRKSSGRFAMRRAACAVSRASASTAMLVSRVSAGSGVHVLRYHSRVSSMAYARKSFVSPALQTLASQIPLAMASATRPFAAKSSRYLSFTELPWKSSTADWMARASRAKRSAAIIQVLRILPFRTSSTLVARAKTRRNGSVRKSSSSIRCASRTWDINPRTRYLKRWLAVVSDGQAPVSRAFCGCVRCADKSARSNGPLGPMSCQRRLRLAGPRQHQLLLLDLLLLHVLERLRVREM